jgi:hypothetical protein
MDKFKAILNFGMGMSFTEQNIPYFYIRANYCTCGNGGKFTQ